MRIIEDQHRFVDRYAQLVTGIPPLDSEGKDLLVIEAEDAKGLCVQKELRINIVELGTKNWR